MSHYETDSKPIPVEPFEVGHGRPDLQQLHDVLDALDNGFPSIFEIRNNIATHINTHN